MLFCLIIRIFAHEFEIDVESTYNTIYKVWQRLF